MIKLKDILLENPDTIEVPHYNLNWEQDDIVVFTYIIKWEIMLTNHKHNAVHGDFNMDKNMKTYMEEYLPNIRYERGDFPEHFIEGRLWKDSKIISLWQYPDKQLFNKMIKAFRDVKLNINDTWHIEIFKYVGSNDIEKFDTMNSEKSHDIYEGMLKPEIINIKDYK